MDVYVYNTESLEIEWLFSNGRWMRSFGIARYMQPVFPNRMSRRHGTCDVGLPLSHLAVRSIRPLPLSVSFICMCMCACILSPLLPSPAGVAHSAPCGRKAYVKPVGLVTRPLLLSSSFPPPHLTPLPVLSRFRTTSIMSVYSLSTEPRCLWQRMNSNLNMYCRRQINIYSRVIAYSSADPACSISLLLRLPSPRHFSSVFHPSLYSSTRAQCFSAAPLLNVI